MPPLRSVPACSLGEHLRRENHPDMNMITLFRLAAPRRYHRHARDMQHQSPAARRHCGLAQANGRRAHQIYENWKRGPAKALAKGMEAMMRRVQSAVRPMTSSELRTGLTAA